MKKNARKSVGLAGLGYWGKNILRNLYELEVLHTACDAREEVLEAYAHDYPGVKFVPSFQEMLAVPSVKAVAVATPAATHYELVKQALLAGKDVFVEKPLSLTVREGEELVELAQQTERILMVGHVLHYHPAVIRLKELVASGELGKIQYIYSNRLNIGKLRTEENILWSFAPHDISVILALLNETPVRVTAFGEEYLNKGVYDTTLTTLEFRNGVKGHIFVSWLHPFKEQKLVVVGSRGMAVFDDVSKEKLFLYPHKIEWKEGKIPVAHKAHYQVIAVDPKEPLREELAHFVECTRHRVKARTDGSEGVRVLRILEKAERSLQSGKVERVFADEKSRSDDCFIHQSAFIDDDVEIGSGTRVWHFSHILKGSRIGRNCVIGQNVMIGPQVTVGDGCKVQNNVSIYKGVTLEDQVFCGPSCVFTNVYTPRAFIERKEEFLPTRVKKGATIGANATIVCGTTIGRYAMIGAGAVVKHDVPDNAVVVGVPAEQVGWACRCGTTLRFDQGKALCDYCGCSYTSRDNSISVSDSD